MRNALLESAISTFEEFGFVLPIERSENSELDIAECTAVSVDFTGPFSGTLELQMETSTLMEIAGNMLGDQLIDQETSEDVLGEFANVICGNALPLIQGTTDVFHLSSPAPFDGAISAVPDAVLRLELDGGWADVSLVINK